ILAVPLVTVATSGGSAMAQGAPPPPPPAPPAPPAAAAPATMAAPLVAMENKPVMPPAGATVHWYENFKYEAFVDTYFSLNYNFPKPQYPGAIPGSPLGGNQFRAYDQQNGFALHWFGLDLTHAPDPVGGGLNLRMGSGAALFTADRKSVV